MSNMENEEDFLWMRARIPDSRLALGDDVPVGEAKDLKRLKGRDDARPTFFEEPSSPAASDQRNKGSEMSEQGEEGGIGEPEDVYALYEGFWPTLLERGRMEEGRHDGGPEATRTEVQRESQGVVTSAKEMKATGTIRDEMEDMKLRIIALEHIVQEHRQEVKGMLQDTLDGVVTRIQELLSDSDRHDDTRVRRLGGRRAETTTDDRFMLLNGDAGTDLVEGRDGEVVRRIRGQDRPSEGRGRRQIPERHKLSETVVDLINVIIDNDAKRASKQICLLEQLLDDEDYEILEAWLEMMMKVTSGWGSKTTLGKESKLARYPTKVTQATPECVNIAVGV